MAAFSSLSAAEARAKVLMASGAAIVAHSARRPNGTIVVRLLRPMSATGTTQDGTNKAGAWDTVSDDGAS
jgi:hypothetical protein